MLKKKNNILLFVSVFISVLGILLFYTEIDYFDQYVTEDGVLENTTALFLFLSSLLVLTRTAKHYHQKKWMWVAVGVLLGVGLLFGAGEEISWGQRIFDIETTDYFKQNNKQNEINLHNLEFNGLSVNKVLSKILSVGFGVYFLVFPVLNQRSKKLAKLFADFGIFLPTVTQIACFVLCTIIVLVIPHERKWEIWEAVFAIVFFAIILKPVNYKEVY